MVRRIDSVSPQKNLRRSGRDRSTIYRSLEENNIVNNIFRAELQKLVGRANELRERELNTHTRPGFTRTGRKISRYNEDSDDDHFGSSDDEERIITRRTRRSSRHDNRHLNDINDENEGTSERRNPKRRRVVEDDDEDEDEDEPEGEVQDVHRESQSPNDSTTMYDRVKRNRNSGRAETPLIPDTSKSNGCDFKAEVVSPRTQRHERRERKELNGALAQKEEEPGKNEAVEEEEESCEDEMPRQYSLRTRRNPVERYAVEVAREQRASRYRDDRFRIKDRHRSKVRSDYKRRMCRSDSSSTGDEDEREFRQSRADDDRFTRRKEISMMKARNRFIPVNLTDKDLSSSQVVIRERLRQTGASCSDIDPMGIDKNVSFEQVGGLGPHIQSLKEVVLFPLLYPDVFQKFDITPPKGVIFYGPPGTGKTLVARALANECSKGERKVAFFMRKGADCLSKWVGESERQLRVLFDQAYAMRPSIIFFDEIDGLAPVRSSRQDQIHASIVSTLLALMDGLDNRGEVVVIGATNRLDSLDPALRRPGRFDRELKFSLPDVSARNEILNIHTNKWGTNKPSEELLNFIGENTSGYCGADLKYLCTEAVLISLRSRYPHIYMTSDRLKLDVESIVVEKDHILKAMKRITPASRRDLSIPSRPLDDRTSIILSSTLEQLLISTIPKGYQRSQSINSISSNELEKVVRALEEPPSVHAVRLLLCGSEKFANCGQTSYVLPALMSRLDHLPVYSLAVGRLFQDGHPEESFTTTIQSVLRSASSGPCILLLPSIEQWYRVVPLSVSHMLQSVVDQLTGFTGVFLLATTDTSYVDCPGEVRDIFKVNNCFEIPSPTRDTRKKYFDFLFSKVSEPPKEFDASKYIEPEKATESEAPVRKLSEKEAKEIDKLYSNQLREFRIFLRDQLGRLVRDRRFAVFAEPVDEEEAKDYYEIIKQPMCLTDMMEKVDRREYTHPDQFLSDVNLIVANALEYNPADNLYGKTIRHSAVALRDIVEEYFEKEFDEDFVEKLEETSRLLKEAEITPKNDKLLELPKGFIRQTKWNVVHCFQNVRRGAIPQANGISTLDNKTVPLRRSTVGGYRKFRRSGNYNLKSTNKKKKSAAIVKSIAQSLSQSADGDNNPEEEEILEGDEQEIREAENSNEDKQDEVVGDQEGGENSAEIVEENNEEKNEEIDEDIVKNEEEPVETTVSEVPMVDVQTEKVIKINLEELHSVMNKVIEKTEGWPVPELERIAAEITHLINLFRDEWDRSKLPSQILNVVTEWSL